MCFRHLISAWLWRFWLGRFGLTQLISSTVGFDFFCMLRQDFCSLKFPNLKISVFRKKYKIWRALLLVFCLPIWTSIRQYCFQCLNKKMFFSRENYQLMIPFCLQLLAFLGNVRGEFRWEGRLVGIVTRVLVCWVLIFDCNQLRIGELHMCSVLETSRGSFSFGRENLLNFHIMGKTHIGRRLFFWVLKLQSDLTRQHTKWEILRTDLTRQHTEIFQVFCCQCLIVRSADSFRFDFRFINRVVKY